MIDTNLIRVYLNAYDLLDHLAGRTVERLCHLFYGTQIYKAAQQYLRRRFDFTAVYWRMFYARLKLLEDLALS